MLRAVIFDMDDTLVDWGQQTGDWFAIRQEGLRPIYEYLRAAGHSLNDLLELSEAYHKQAELAWSACVPPEWNSPRQINILRNTLQALNLPIDEIDLEHVQRLYDWGVYPGVRAFDDAVTVLQALRSPGIRTGLITNTSLPMWMRDVELQALGLLEHLDVRLTAADVGKVKPHPKPFHVALERLGVSPEEAVFVGDRLHDDVAGAQRVGMRAVWVRRGERSLDGQVKPNAIINSLTELLNVLDVWYPGWRR